MGRQTVICRSANANAVQRFFIFILKGKKHICTIKYSHEKNNTVPPFILPAK
jgi:hypothetical protein